MRFFNLKCVGQVVLLTASVWLLAGCMPHLNQKQCLSMNWYQMGVADGQKGRSQRDLSRDIQDCAKFKLKVNQSGYQKGWRVGTRQYCRPGTAFQLGMNGRNYNHICPSDLKNSFNAAWRRGLRKYCIPSTGYNLGRSGKPMPSFCGSNQVVKFRNAYAAGSRVYGTIIGIRNNINHVNDQIAGTQSQIQGKRNDVRHLLNLLANGDHGKPIGPETKALTKRNIQQDYAAITRLTERKNRQIRHRNSLRDQLSRERNM